MENEVRRLRVQMQLDLETFGDLFGVSEKAVRAWEAGLRTPSGACQIIMEQLADDKLRKWHLRRLKEAAH